MIELALAMPVLCLLLLAIVQFAVVARDQLTMIEAARAAVRAASVSADPAGSATVSARATIRSDTRTAVVDTSVNGRFVTVSVTVINPTDVPLIGLLLPDVRVTGDATMILEPP